MSPVRALPNPLAATEQDLEPPGRAPLDFHRRLPEYAATPLVDAPGLAGSLGVGKVWVKDESWRLGLPAFKILGASWAVYRALEQRSGGIGGWGDVEELRRRLAPLLPLTLAAATDGNHGRAVARMARMLGLGARIFVPAGMAPARIEAIRSEGAEVVVVRGTYDEAVARSAEEAGGRCLVISDTSWPGYEDVPRWVIDGYSTILWEVEDELGRLGEGGPTLVVVQIGVGAFAAAVTRHFRSPGVSPRPKILGVEPARAACALASAEAGGIVHLPGPHDSIMAGLNCGSPSVVAWPVVSKGVDLFVEIEDRWAREAMRMLAAAGIVSGETGAAGLAGLLALTREGDRGELGLTEEARVLVFNCEGATDPGAYGRILAGTDIAPPDASP
ncbi:MAG: diaminopropionate ammonia-lyase [Actinomycetota bacterium]|nr:diaminopropionate ammonia-lyase [Actinomycetota bacterium]